MQSLRKQASRILTVRRIRVWPLFESFEGEFFGLYLLGAFLALLGLLKDKFLAVVNYFFAFFDVAVALASSFMY